MLVLQMENNYSDGVKICPEISAKDVVTSVVVTFLKHGFFYRCHCQLGFLDATMHLYKRVCPSVRR